MKSAARRSPSDRDRAVARLRVLTIGSGIASMAALGGFGALAALSYDGTPTEVTTAAVVATDTSSSTSDSTSMTTGSSTSTPTTGAATTQATAAPTATTGTAHAATGSS